MRPMRPNATEWNHKKSFCLTRSIIACIICVGACNNFREQQKHILPVLPCSYSWKYNYIYVVWTYTHVRLTTNIILIHASFNIPSLGSSCANALHLVSHSSISSGSPRSSLLVNMVRWMRFSGCTKTYNICMCELQYHHL